MKVSQTDTAPPTRRTVSQVGANIFGGISTSFAVLALALLAGIIVALTVASWPSIVAFGPSFLVTSEWNPPAEQFGALIPIYGTLVSSAIALVVAVPVSFGIALFLTELSPLWLRRPLGTAIELLAAVPSIVFGMWGLLVFAPIFGEYIEPALGATLGKLPLIGALFSALGYVPNATQSAQSQTGIIWLMSVIPAAFTLAAAGLMVFYPLDNPTMARIQADLAARQAATSPP